MIRLLTHEEAPLGQQLVREYVDATAEEMGVPVAELLPFIPDYEDWAPRYAEGAFLVAFVDGVAAGCVGITPADGGRCEMNRLWVRPAYRSLGLGPQLVAASLEQARQLGFTRMSLDVLPTRTRAIELYRRSGFRDSPGYHDYGFAMVPLERDL